MPHESPTLILLAREPARAATLGASLGASLRVESAPELEAALAAFQRFHAAALVVDLPDDSAATLDAVRQARALDPAAGIVILLDDAQSEVADRLVQLGADDVQSRPLRIERLRAVVTRAIERQRRPHRRATPEGRGAQRSGLAALTARSRGMQRVVEQARRVAGARTAVLISGEPGSGKAALAEAIHRESPRREHALWTLRCGDRAEAETEVELFGRERDGVLEQRGLFESSEGGTLVLADIERAGTALQLRLLRAFHSREFERVGGRESRHADARVILTTCVALEAEVSAGRFRADLFERLALASLEVPPLRERGEDLPALVAGFIREFNRDHSRRVTGVTPGVLERLAAHVWPGNVRELRNALEAMVVFAEGRRPLDLSDLPPALHPATEAEAGLVAGMTVEEAERELIVATLRHTRYDKTRAAAMLGIGLRTLYRKLRSYGVSDRDPSR